MKFVEVASVILRNAMLKRYGDNAPWAEDRIADAVLGAVEADRSWKPTRSGNQAVDRLVYLIVRGWIAAQRAATSESEEPEIVVSDLAPDEETSLAIFEAAMADWEDAIDNSLDESEPDPSLDVWSEWIADAIVSLDDTPDPSYTYEVPVEQEPEYVYESRYEIINARTGAVIKSGADEVKASMGRVPTSVPWVTSLDSVTDDHNDRDPQFYAYEAVDGNAVIASHLDALDAAREQIRAGLEPDFSPFLLDPRVQDGNDENAVEAVLRRRLKIKKDDKEKQDRHPDGPAESDNDVIKRLRTWVIAQVQTGDLWPSQAAKLLALADGLSPREASGIANSIYRRSRAAKEVVGVTRLPTVVESAIGAQLYPINWKLLRRERTVAILVDFDASALDADVIFTIPGVKITGAKCPVIVIEGSGKYPARCAIAAAGVVILDPGAAKSARTREISRRLGFVVKTP